LAQVLSSSRYKDKDKDKDLLAIIKELGKSKLDREKLELWEHWLSDMDEDTTQRLQGILDDTSAVSSDLAFALAYPDRKLHTLKRQFMHAPVQKQLEDLLVKHEFSLATTPTNPSRTLSKTSSRESNSSSPRIGYNV
jgi:hypothetical protein